MKDKNIFGPQDETKEEKKDKEGPSIVIKNSEIELEAETKDDKFHGKMSILNKKESKKMEIEYKDGSMMHMVIYEDGNKLMSMGFKDDKLEGEMVQFDPSGEVKSVQNFKEDKLDGVSFYFEKPGDRSTIKEILFENGEVKQK